MTQKSSGGYYYHDHHHMFEYFRSLGDNRQITDATASRRATSKFCISFYN